MSRHVVAHKIPLRYNLGWRPTLLETRTLVGAPGLTTRSKKLLGTKGIATRRKDATRLEAIASMVGGLRKYQTSFKATELRFRRFQLGSFEANTPRAPTGLVHGNVLSKKMQKANVIW